MRKIITAFVVVLAMFAPSATTVPAAAVTGTTVASGWYDVQRTKATTRAAFKRLTWSQKKRLCRTYDYAPKAVVRSLAKVSQRYGASKRDARKGVRKAMRLNCRWF